MSAWRSPSVNERSSACQSMVLRMDRFRIVSVFGIYVRVGLPGSAIPQSDLKAARVILLEKVYALAIGIVSR